MNNKKNEKKKKLIEAEVHLAFCAELLAAIYPSQLVDAICEGIQNQIKANKFDMNSVATIEQINSHNILAALKERISRTCCKMR